MKTRDEIIKDQLSIGNVQINFEEYCKLEESGVFFIEIENDILYFKPISPKPEIKDKIGCGKEFYFDDEDDEYEFQLHKELERQKKNQSQKDTISQKAFVSQPSDNIQDKTKTYTPNNNQLAKQCLNFKGFNCNNKDCLNEDCPLCDLNEKDKNVFEEKDYKIIIEDNGLTIQYKGINYDGTYYFDNNISIPLLKEAIKEHERRFGK